MKIAELFARAKETMDARVVYAEPVEKDGITVIPAARVFGGGGGGNGQDKLGQEAEGGGLGLVARPVGAFVIQDGKVWWQPAIDVNRLIATVGGVAIAGLLVGVRILRLRAGSEEG
ncbi:spore germination protein GerW family protein [Actinophytocola oryzae]|uniref:Putative spore protein YtfJ n=1 Tax=Actinophytocola oryzae TaxID=502181 RepID=A0A4R7W3W0_9PSEU|nr:spore germination protein GerW family protein [Actinophytocola oryzae]TDV57346.1 putative spore protein YtfJ [Actinophytocola oryzae]